MRLPWRKMTLPTELRDGEPVYVQVGDRSYTRLLPGDWEPGGYPDGYPPPDWSSAWSTLRAHVRRAELEGQPLKPVEVLRYMDELKDEAMEPVRRHSRSATTGRTNG